MAGRPPEGKRLGGKQQGARARRRVRARAEREGGPGSRVRSVVPEHDQGLSGVAAGAGARTAR